MAVKDWSPIFKGSYNPLKAGSIDATDTEPHDHGIIRAMGAKYKPNKDVLGDPHKTVFISRLNPKTEEETIERVFSKYGAIKRFRLVRDIVTGFSRCYAFVEYEEHKAADSACRKAYKHEIDGCEIFVDNECEQLLKGWIPRRQGGGLGGKKESGQLRFGGRDRPFRKPILEFNYLKNFKQTYDQNEEKEYDKNPEPRHDNRDRNRKTSDNHHDKYQGQRKHDRERSTDDRYRSRDRSRDRDRQRDRSTDRNVGREGRRQNRSRERQRERSRDRRDRNRDRDKGSNRDRTREGSREARELEQNRDRRRREGSREKLNEQSRNRLRTADSMADIENFESRMENKYDNITKVTTNNSDNDSSFYNVKIKQETESY